MRRTRRAFTVLEVLVALGLIALLIGSVLALIGELGSTRARVASDWRAWRGTDAVFDRLERDLACVIAGDVRLGAGVQGRGDSLALLTRGVWVPAESGGRGGRSSPGTALAGDLSRIEYECNGAEGVRYRERPVTRKSGVGAEPPERAGLLAEPGSTVRFRYFNGREWLDSFDSLREGSLPLAVEVAVWLNRPEASEGKNRGFPPPSRVRVISIPDARGGPNG